MPINKSILQKLSECNGTKIKLYGTNPNDEKWQVIPITPHKNPQNPLGPPIM